MLIFKRYKQSQFFCQAIEKYGISSRIGGNSEERLYEVYQGRYHNKTIEAYKEHPKCK